MEERSVSQRRRRDEPRSLARPDLADTLPAHQVARRPAHAGAVTQVDALALQRTLGNRQARHLLPIGVASRMSRMDAGPLTVQRITEEELKGRGATIREMAKDAPERGVHLWKVSHKGSSVHLLGTEHARKLSEVGSDASLREYLITFLTTGQFTSVYTEKIEEIPYLAPEANLAEQLEKFISVKADVEKGLKAAPSSREFKIATSKLANARTGGLDAILSLSLDQAYLSLATSGREPKRLNLETDDTRLEAKKSNMRDMGIEDSDPTHRLYKPDGATDDAAASDASFRRGDQKSLFKEVADEMESGRDLASGEERNRQWMDVFKNALAETPEVKQLWIVGAAHLPGLILRFKELGWEVEHQAPPTL